MKTRIISIVNSKAFQNTIIFLLASITILALNLNLDVVPNEAVELYTDKFLKVFGKLRLSFYSFNIVHFIILYLVFLFYKSIYFKTKEKKGILIFLACLFSFFLVFGYSFSKVASWDLIFGGTIQTMKALILFLGYFFLFYAIIFRLFSSIKKYSLKENKSKIKEFIFDKHPILCCSLLLLLMWLPYIILRYPGVIMWDAGTQIKQFFNVPNYTSSTVHVLNENVLITNHHSAFCTILMGLCIQVGKMFGNDNMGLFLFTLLQVTGFVLILSYSIFYMRKCKVPYWVCIITLLFFGLFPVFPVWAITVGKDTIASYMILLYIILLVDLLRDPSNILKHPWKMLGVLLCMVACSLFRNNGVYTILLSFLFLLLPLKKWRKQIGIILIIFISCFLGYTKFVLPYFGISEGSKREMLSIPFQQTARLVKEKKIDKKDKKKIDRVLSYDDIKKNYNPELSDPVKNTFRINSTSKDMNEYFKVWGKYLVKYPTIYIQATMNNAYGYFYPNSFAQKEYIHWGITRNIKDTDKVHFENNPKYESVSQVLIQVILMLRQFPIIGALMSVGFYGWLVILELGYVCYIKKYKWIIPLLPFVITLLVCVASPVNGYLRYALPIVFSTPFILSYLITLKPEKERRKI